MLRRPAVTWVLCTLAAMLVSHARGVHPSTLFSLDTPPDQRCLSADSIPTAGLNLTAEEAALLPHICVTEDDIRGDDHLAGGVQTRNGIPPGVTCTPTDWCDGAICTTVCARGSVVIDPWLARTLRLQARLSRSLPLCFTTLFGSHNSAITLADGYGNLDCYFEGLFKYVKWASRDLSHARLQTNDHWLSLTDQLNLGVRVLELDTHWVGDDLRIAHCGGLHVAALNSLVKALNLVAKVLHRHIQWDTETLGCSPSLSSIPAMRQRLLAEALQEIKDWADKPENRQEFLIVYFDDQQDLQTWGVAGKLQEAALATFPRPSIFTQEDLASHKFVWPTPGQMVASGHRFVFVSGADYGAATAPTIFPKGDAVCGWREPPLRTIEGVPQCSVDGQVGANPTFFDGALIRAVSCELTYGPLNCDFAWTTGDEAVLDEASLPDVLGCGLNVPSPDLLTPTRAAAAVWTWAPGHPYPSQRWNGSIGQGDARKIEVHAFGNGDTVAAVSRRLTLQQQSDTGDAAEPADDAGTLEDERLGGCGVLSGSDGRWRAVTCRAVLPSACRRKGARLSWDEMWTLGGGPRGSCPRGWEFDLPRHPRENYILAEVVRAAGVAAVWLPVTGPDWNVDKLPSVG